MSTTAAAHVPISIDDPINARILAVSEDRIQGFQRDPIGEIARLSGVDAETVIERIRAMLEAGVVRRVRQTLLATNLAQGALVAWQVPEERLQEAFDYMFKEDPFSGHVVIRSTDSAIAGARFRLWTTVKVPQGFSIRKHCEYLASQTGALKFLIMPARRLFALGVGHVRRKSIEPGSKADVPAEPVETGLVELNELEWKVLMPLKREFRPDEIRRDLWKPRARESDVPIETFYDVAQGLNERRVVGRFSTFLEHKKQLKTGEQVARFNALFHWAVPPGREIEAGSEVGRFHVMTHAYWREGGPEFGNVNIMGVAHGHEKEWVLAHKRAIDAHLESVGIPVVYTNVFWGGRSEIKPSEISPLIYHDWLLARGLNPEVMRREKSEETGIA